MAFARVAGNRGANTPGIDGWTVAMVEERVGVPGFLDGVRTSLKEGTFRPLPVRERAIANRAGRGRFVSQGAAWVGVSRRSNQRWARTIRAR
jgi:RNA-directed DNA polymerase